MRRHHETLHRMEIVIVLVPSVLPSMKLVLSLEHKSCGTIMSGFRIIDSYRAYKVQERKFTDWLRANSKSKSSQEKSPIRINEIPSLTKLIVSRGQSIPETLLRSSVMLSHEGKKPRRSTGHRVIARQMRAMHIISRCLKGL